MLGWSARWMAAGAAAGAMLVLVFSPQVGRERRFDVRAGGGVAGLPEAPGSIASPVPSTPGTTPVSRTRDGGRMVWSEAGDIWLYEAATGELRPLTGDGQARSDFLPRFRGAGRVTFLSLDGHPDNEYHPGLTARPSVLREIDLATGRVRDVADLGAGVMSVDWSPDGATLAVYAAPGDGTPGDLRLVSEDWQTSIRRLPPVWGRGGFVNYDDRRVEWSPDGRHLLLVDTGMDTSQEETLYVLNASGTDALAPRAGTWARWGADGRTIYCACAVGPSDQQWPWQAIDVDHGIRTPLVIKRGMRPSVSPDGRYLAFDDGEDTPSIHVLDLAEPGSLPRRVTGAAMAPVWLGSGHLAVTDTRPCPEDEDSCMAGGHGSMFLPAGTVAVVVVATGERQTIVPGSTEDADT